MARIKKTDQERLETRQQILNAAKSLYMEGGLKEVTTRAIASKLSMSPGKIYSYFAGSYEIIAAVLWDTTHSLEQELVAAAQNEPDPERRLKALVGAYTDFAEHHWEAFRITFLQLDAKPSDIVMIAPEPLERPGYVAVRKTIMDGISSGLFVDEDADVLAQSVWAAVFGAIVAQRSIQGFKWKPNEQIVDTVISKMMIGLKSH